MQEIELRHPLKVNGKDYKVLKCDMDAVTVDGFMRAEDQAKKGREGVASVMEMDYTFHLYLGFEGIVAAMPEVDVSDLKRLRGVDVTHVMQAGRAFLTGSADGDSEEETSDDAPEPTPTSMPRASRR